MIDYYSLLGVEQKATKSEIKKNYRKLAAKYHPDKNPAPDAAEKFIAITEAYDVLSNDKLKVKYDLLRWQKLKQEKEATASYGIVVPPFESTRTRRNKAQRKRSLNYHSLNSDSKKRWQLFLESLHINSRYLVHLLGITLSLVIATSAISQLSDTFEKNSIRGLIIAAFIFGFVYIIYLIVKNALREIKMDVESFSVFYKVARKKAANILLFTSMLILIIYAALLKNFF